MQPDKPASTTAKLIQTNILVVDDNWVSLIVKLLTVPLLPGVIAMNGLTVTLVRIWWWNSAAISSIMCEPDIC